MLTPYQYASNSPIAGIDRDGLEFTFYGVLTDKAGTTIGLYKAGELDKELKVRFNLNIDGVKDSRSFRIKASEINLKEKFISDGKTFYHIPQGFDISQLPSPGDATWKSFESYDNYLNRIVDKGN